MGERRATLRSAAMISPACCCSRFELVKSMLPPEHHKVLANIRKAEARTKRKRLASEEQDESESEEEAPKAKSQR